MPGDGVRVVRFPGSPSILDPVSDTSRTVTSERDLVHVLRRAASDVNTLYIVTDEDAPWCCSFAPNVLVVASPDSAIESMRSLGRLAVRPSQPCQCPRNRVSGRVPETALVGFLLWWDSCQCLQNPVSGRVPETAPVGFRPVKFPCRAVCLKPVFSVGVPVGLGPLMKIPEWGPDSGTRRDTDVLPRQDGGRFRWTPQIGAIASVLQTATAVGQSGATVSTF